jgi:hypothetical protein
MTIEIVDFPIEHGDFQHSFLYVYQGVNTPLWIVGYQWASTHHLGTILGDDGGIL